MWDRAILKSNAKIALRGRFWTAFGVCLLGMVIAGGYSIITFRFNLDYSQMVRNSNLNIDELMAISGRANLLSLIGLAYAIFVALPIVIGLSRFFVHNHFGVTQFETMFSGFKQNYLNGVGALAVTYLFAFLWSLLLFIPGLIKLLEYSMVPYILADNPSMPGSRAREISRTMTRGEKGAIFILYLSFIGWYLLCMVGYIIGAMFGSIIGYFVGGIFGTAFMYIGTLFLIPYMQATFAELYIFLRDRAIQTNQVNPAELGLIAPAPFVDPTAPIQ